MAWLMLIPLWQKVKCGKPAATLRRKGEVRIEFEAVPKSLISHLIVATNTRNAVNEPIALSSAN